MVFSSITFVYAFFPLVAVAYYLSKNRVYRNVVLLLASLLFYSWGEPRFLLLMLAATLAAYCGGLLMEAQHRAQEAYSDRHSRPARRKSLRLQISEFLFGEPFRPVRLARTAEADAPHRHQLLYLPDPFVCDRPVPR